MSEWWTYGLRDLLLFSPRTYYRLFERYNLELWPLPLVALALGVAVLALAWQGGHRARRGLAVILAVCWLWIAWGFHWQRYASINPAASYFALAFAFQALFLLWLAAQGRLDVVSSRWERGAGLGLLLFAVVIFPLLGPLWGRSWIQAEVFGMAPDPTALATLGVLLCVGASRVWGCLLIPVAWTLVTGATLWAMDAPDFAIVPLASLLAVAVAAGGRGASAGPHPAPDIRGRRRH